VKKSELLRALQHEIRRHDFNYFIDEPPAIAGEESACRPCIGLRLEGHENTHRRQLGEQAANSARDGSQIEPLTKTLQTFLCGVGVNGLRA
jgi:hypothetical protein